MSIFITEYARYYILTCFSMGVALATDGMLLKRRRSYWPMGIYLAVKTLAVNIILKNAVEFGLGNGQYFDTFYVLAVFATSLFTYFMYCYTFEDRFVKIALGALVGELAGSFFIVFSSFLVNLLERRPDPLDYGGHLHPLDPLILLLCGGMYLLMRRVFGTFLEKFQNYRIKHEKIWGFFAAGMIFFLSMSLFGDGYSYSIPALYITELLGVAVGTGLAIWICAGYCNEVIKRNAYLTAVRRLRSTHYMTLQSQISRMEQSQCLIDQQMHEIAEKEKPENEQIASYLTALRMEYEQIKAGIYCNDWLIDALLFEYREKLRETGGELECSLHGYDRGEIPEQELTEILLLLLDWFAIERMPAVQDGKKRLLTVRMSEVKQRLAAELEANWKVNGYFPYRKLRAQIRKYHGILQLERGEDRTTVFISMDNRSFQ